MRQYNKKSCSFEILLQRVDSRICGSPCTQSLSMFHVSEIMIIEGYTYSRGTRDDFVVIESGPSLLETKSLKKSAGDKLGIEYQYHNQ